MPLMNPSTRCPMLNAPGAVIRIASFSATAKAGLSSDLAIEMKRNCFFFGPAAEALPISPAAMPLPTTTASRASTALLRMSRDFDFTTLTSSFVGFVPPDAGAPRPILVHRPPRSLRGGDPRAADPVDHDGGHDHGAERELLPVRRHAQQHQPVRQHADERGAEDHA